MKSYRGTGTASRYHEHRLQTRTVPFASIEARDADSARTKALREMEQQYPTADGFSHVVGLEEVEGDDE